MLSHRARLTLILKKNRLNSSLISRDNLYLWRFKTRFDSDYLFICVDFRKFKKTGHQKKSTF